MGKHQSRLRPLPSPAKFGATTETMLEKMAAPQRGDRHVAAEGLGDFTLRPFEIAEWLWPGSAGALQSRAAVLDTPPGAGGLSPRMGSRLVLPCTRTQRVVHVPPLCPGRCRAGKQARHHLARSRLSAGDPCRRGRSRAIGPGTGFGVAAAAFLWAVAATFGVAALLARFAVIYAAIQIAGGIYLIWLGFAAWRHGGAAAELPEAAPPVGIGRAVLTASC